MPQYCEPQTDGSWLASGDRMVHNIQEPHTRNSRNHGKLALVRLSAGPANTTDRSRRLSRGAVG